MSLYRFFFCLFVFLVERQQTKARSVVPPPQTACENSSVDKRPELSSTGRSRLLASHLEEAEKTPGGEGRGGCSHWSREGRVNSRVADFYFILFYFFEAGLEGWAGSF